eukprot:353181-Chlamydomonas_euryale.AAC.2
MIRDAARIRMDKRFNYNYSDRFKAQLRRSGGGDGSLASHGHRMMLTARSAPGVLVMQQQEIEAQNSKQKIAQAARVPSVIWRCCRWAFRFPTALSFPPSFPTVSITQGHTPTRT